MMHKLMLNVKNKIEQEVAVLSNNAKGAVTYPRKIPKSMT